VTTVEREPETPGLIELIARQRDDLRPSHAKVAEVVLDNPLEVVGLSIAGLAKAAGVSEPTVVRFCADVGFDGYRSFKIALAQAVALGLPVENAIVRRTDTTAQLVEKVFGRTISSLDRARRSIDTEAVERAVGLILEAREVLFLGLGASGIVAADAQQKFFLFGVPCAAPADSHQQLIAASVSGPGVAAVAFSETGATEEVLRAARAVKERGGSLVAVTGNDGPLGALATVEIRAATFEDTEMFAPTVSRLAALVVVDILASGVAVRRPRGALEPVRAMRERLTQVRAAERRHEDGTAASTASE
jgi:RpiR family carbohydrate utilization transcriptional regulator